MSDADLIHAYGEYLTTEKHASENTVASYLRDVRQFSEYLNRVDLGPLVQASSSEVQLFAAWQKKNGKSPASVARYLASVKSFFSYLVLEGVLTDNPAAAVMAEKAEKKLPRILTGREVEKLLEHYLT